MAKVTCVIAAYNEQQRINGVLEAVCACNEISEIIVVDDGSTDHTSDVVRRWERVRLISHPENKGKSAAVAMGIEEAKGDIILLLDADLIGLTSRNIKELVEPVLSGNTDVTLSLRGNSLTIYRLLNLDFITGDRVIAKKVFDGQFDAIKKLPSYGLEVFMNRLIIQDNQRIQIIPFDDVVSPRKYAKIGFWTGRYADMLMIKQILRVITVFEVMDQYLKMMRLSSHSSSREGIR